VLVKKKFALTLSCLLFAMIIATSVLDSAGAATNRLVVQNVNISPRFAKIGENVQVKASIRNNEHETKNCHVKTFLGDSVIEEIKEISISPQDTFPLLFTIETSSLTQGEYPIEMVIEEAPNEQSLFSLGTLTVEQETPVPTSTPSSTNSPAPSQEPQSASFDSNLIYLVPVIPVAAVVSFFVWKKEREKRKEQKMPEGLLPNLLNEVLNFEEKVETGVEKSKNSSNDKSYIC
jgi:hypothetical protein